MSEENKSLIRDIDYALFERILQRVDTTKMDMMQIARMIYDTTFLTYKSQWIEEWNEVQRMSTLVVTKNVEIDRLNGRVAELTMELEKHGVKTYEGIDSGSKGIDVPKESDTGTTDAQQVLPFCQGSKIDTRYPGHHSCD